MKTLTLFLVSLFLAVPAFSQISEQQFIHIYAKKFEKKFPKFERITNRVLSKLPLDKEPAEYSKLYITELIITQAPPEEGPVVENLLQYLADATLYYHECVIFDSNEVILNIEDWYSNSKPKFSYIKESEFGKKVLPGIPKYKGIRKMQLQPFEVERFEAIKSLNADYAFTVKGRTSSFVGTFIIKNQKVFVMLESGSEDENTSLHAIPSTNGYCLIPIKDYIENFNDFHFFFLDYFDFKDYFNGKRATEVIGY